MNAEVIPAWHAAIERSTNLAELEAIVQKGKAAFMEVGAALIRIHKAQLWKDTHRSWEAYCEQRWGWSRQHAYRLMTAAKVAEAMSPTGDTPVGPPVKTERHARELARLPNDASRVNAMAAAMEAAGEHRPTTEHVRAAVDAELAKVAPTLPGEGFKTRTREALTSSESVEFYTPQEFTDAARRVMGSIDLDPASNTEANGWIGATRIFTQDDNGLAHPWGGNVWLNCPYGYLLELDGGGWARWDEDDDQHKGKRRPSQHVWLSRLISHVQSGEVPQACALFGASTGDVWWQPLWAQPLCFPLRIPFLGPGAANGGGNTRPSVIAYFGPNVEAFVEHFGPLGHIVLPKGQIGESA